MLDVKKYIGKTYQEYNCYELFCAIQGELGNSLPDYTTSGSSIGAEKTDLEMLKKFVKIDKPVIGCGVLMCENGLPTHIGVYIGEGKVVHSKQSTGVIITDLAFENVYGYYGVCK